MTARTKEERQYINVLGVDYPNQRLTIDGSIGWPFTSEWRDHLIR